MAGFQVIIIGRFWVIAEDFVQTVRSQFSHRLFSPALPWFLQSVIWW